MADIQKMLEQKEKLQQKIKEEKKKEYEKFGRWFFNKLNVNRSADAKKIINEYLLDNDNFKNDNRVQNEILDESKINSDEYNENSQNNSNNQ